MTQEQKDLVINHIATLWTNAQNGDTLAWNDLWNRMIKNASVTPSTEVENKFGNDFDLCKTDERRAEVAANFAEVILQYFKVRELDKLGKELEAAEAQKAIERNLAESDERRAISDEVNVAREAVLEAAGGDKRAEAEARMRQLIENHEFASTEYRDALRALAQKYAGDDAIVESFPVAVEYLRDCFLELCDGDLMALTFPRCRLVKRETLEAWREVENKYWNQSKFARNGNRYKEADERQIAQEFAEAVLPLCKLDELEKIEQDVEEEKKRAAICKECVEIEQRLRDSAETKVELEEARARIWYAGYQYGWRKDQKRLDALRAIELCKEHKTASERVVKRLRAAIDASNCLSGRDGFVALLERVNAPEWLRAYLTNNVSYHVLTKDAAQLMIDCCDVEKLEAEADVYDLTRAYILDGDDRVLDMISGDALGAVCELRRAPSRELRLEEAVAIVLDA